MMITSAWKALLLGAVLSGAAAPALAKEPPAGPKTERMQIGSFAGAYLAARVAETDKDLDAATDYYTRALMLDPANKELQQSLMLALLAGGRFDEALPLAEKLKAEPEIERFSRLALGVDALRDKEFRAAGNLFQLALQSDLDRLVTSILSSWAKFGEAGGAEALATVKGIEGPDWYRVFRTYHQALIADAGGDKEEAAKAYRALVEDADGAATAPDTYLRGAEAYARFLAREGRKADALAVLDQAEESAPGRVTLAAIRERIGKGEAVGRAVETPADGAAEMLLNMAAALNRGGGEPFVRLYLNLALVLRPGDDEALVQLAAAAEDEGKGEAAIELYRRIPADSPLKRGAELQLGLNLADLKRYDEAEKHLAALKDADPADMRAYLALGSVHAAQDDYRAAAQVYDEAVAALGEPTPEHWNIFYQRGIAYERLKEWPKAEPNFLKALELYPDQPQVLNYLGYSWVDMNMNLERGLEMIKKAVELRPGDGYIVDSLGWAYYRLGRYEEAVTELERAVQLKPDDPVLNDHLGDAYWRVGRKLEATFQWSHARDLKPEDPAVLAGVEKKLREGLPDGTPKAASGEAPKVE